MKRSHWVSRLLVAGLALALLLSSATIYAADSASGPLTGAIHTTTVDGVPVNKNIYESKVDVYLEGGPGPKAPLHAAALPAGKYYFMVTDPSGKVNLSIVPVEDRWFEVDERGLIVSVNNWGSYFLPDPRGNGKRGTTFNQPPIGFDDDHPDNRTVPLFPYHDTPNPGGVYKVWVTRMSDYKAGQGFHGFLPSRSKTDNFKVKGPKPVPPVINVKKFQDANLNGMWDSGEPELFDWCVSYTDPLGVEFGPMLMPLTVDNALPAGTWAFTEQVKDGWFQTCAYVDGVKQSPLSATAMVAVAGTDKEVHTIVFGNAPKGSAKAFKFLDKNLNGVYDKGEEALADVTFTLSGTDYLGNPVGDRVEKTGADGYATWTDLMPGTYTIVETVPKGSFATTPLSQNICVKPGEAATACFGNARYASVSGAKFYDTNTNGSWDTGENPIMGWKVILTGVDYLGNSFGPDVQYTGANGYYKWENLLPGEYTVTEVMPKEPCWFNTTPLSGTRTVAEGSDEVVYFGNACTCSVDFNTKGFWHNKNGLALIQQSWIDYVNGLAPYQANPFDGIGADGKPVPAAKNAAGETVAGAGTALAEISAYLVNSNSGGDPKIQLGQQMLAFIFNVKANNVCSLEGPDGKFCSAESMIGAGVNAWSAGGSQAGNWAGVFDRYNNNDAVKVLCDKPCAFSY